ncbi:MAG TPA: hypothetical protein VKE51_05780 [Vicinamibacterales bacterium]|nr:hypothetical protein [Vicinamibacterales bacterium]
MAKKRSTIARAPALTAKKARSARRKRAARTRKRATTPRARTDTIKTATDLSLCLDYADAAGIVQSLIPGGPHDVNSTLRQLGVNGVPQREAFVTKVGDAVVKRGCSLDTGGIPGDAATTLEEVIEYVWRFSRRSPASR